MREGPDQGVGRGANGNREAVQGEAAPSNKSAHSAGLQQRVQQAAANYRVRQRGLPGDPLPRPAAQGQQSEAAELLDSDPDRGVPEQIQREKHLGRDLERREL